jgi:hypothetical protein
MVLMVALMSAFVLAQTKPTTPDEKDQLKDYVIRLQKIQIDELAQQNHQLQYAAQYQAATQTLQHDQQEYAEIQTEGLKAIGKDPVKFQINTDTGVSEPAPAPQAAVKGVAK